MFSISDAVITILSLLTLTYVIKTTRIAFKKHYLNIFSHLMLILIVFSLLSKYTFSNYPIKVIDEFLLVCAVRSLFFLTHLDMFTYKDENETVGVRAPVFAFIWTYPLINYIVISYTTSSHWVYDLMTIIHGNQAPQVIRRQMKVFVVAIVIFVIIMYLVYMLSLPAGDTIENLEGVYFYLAIFEWLCAAILVISIFLYVRRISMNNRVYGKAVLMEAVVFAFANTVAGFFNYYMSKNYVGDLLQERDSKSVAVYSSIMIPYFCVTEFIPAATFAHTMQVLARVLSGEVNEAEEARQA